MPRSEGTPPVALTIAGVDPTGTAGAAADLRTFAAHGVHGALAVTVVTAQDTTRLGAIEAMPPELVGAEIAAVTDDLHPVATKTGMLASEAVLGVVGEAVATLGHLVVDPVLVDSAGRPLFPAAVTAGYRLVAAGARVLTPNLDEASLLLGESVSSVEDAEEAARELHRLGPDVVVVTGGRRRAGTVVDVVFDGRSLARLEGAVLDTKNVRGSGCTFSAAVTANLALGAAPLSAVTAAHDFVKRALRASARWHLSRGPGPLDQLSAAPGALPQRSG